MFLRNDVKSTSNKKKKIDGRDVTEFKNFCASKNTIKKVKTEPAEWGRSFANHVADKGLGSTRYKQLLKFNKKKRNGPTMKLLCNLFLCAFENF